MRAFKCDRCGELYVPDKRIPPYILSKKFNVDNGYKYCYIDLCLNCQYSFSYWLTNEEQIAQDLKIKAEAIRSYKEKHDS